MYGSDYPRECSTDLMSKVQKTHGQLELKKCLYSSQSFPIPNQRHVFICTQNVHAEHMAGNALCFLIFILFYFYLNVTSLFLHRLYISTNTLPNLLSKRCSQFLKILKCHSLFHDFRNVYKACLYLFDSIFHRVSK